MGAIDLLAYGPSSGPSGGVDCNCSDISLSSRMTSTVGEVYVRFFIVLLLIIDCLTLESDAHPAPKFF
jgi:hypothetical protein